MNLKYILDDELHGRIQHKLDFDARQQEYNQRRKQRNIVAKVSDYVRTTALSPEEIVLEQERISDLLHLVQAVRKTLPADDFAIFWTLAVEGKSQEYVAELYNVSQQSISQKYQRIIANLQNHFREIAGELLYSNIKNALGPSMSTKEARTPQIKIRYPSEFLSKLYTGGRRGKRVWINHTKCATLDYLDECFGDQQTCCMYCEQCKNKIAKARARL